MSLTPHQQQKIRRMRSAAVDCQAIAAALKLDIRAVSGFLAQEKNVRSMRSMGEIARLVTVKCPEAWMRRHRVDYSR